jgi:hypothetical protein
MIPAAWVAWAAAPVNSVGEGVAVVGVVPLPDGVGVALTLVTGAADEAASDVTGAAEDTAADEDGASDEAGGASVLVATAEDGAAEDASGTSIGTPAAAQVSSVAAMAAA